MGKRVLRVVNAWSGAVREVPLPGGVEEPAPVVKRRPRRKPAPVEAPAPVVDGEDDGADLV